MDFEGLQSLLKKKKKDTTTSTTKKSEDELYAKAHHKVQEQQQQLQQPPADLGTESRKREREEKEEEPADEAVTQVPLAAAPPPPTLLEKDAVVAQQLRAITTLTHSLQKLAALKTKKCLAGTQPVTVGDAMAALEAVVPPVVMEYLRRQYTDEEDGTVRSSSSSATDEVACEFQLLQSMAAAQPPELAEDKGRQEAVGTAAGTLERLRQLLHVFWFLILSHWRLAIAGDLLLALTIVKDGTLPTAATAAAAMDAEGGGGGYSYPVYLLFHHQPLPSTATPGATTLLAVQQRLVREAATWRGRVKTHLQAMRLMALLVEDYRTLSTAGRSHKDDDEAAALLVPESIRDGLYNMLVSQLQQRRAFAGCRQAYVDLTHGNANWKLGLYSRGEVHRRGATDRVDRNDVAHLLQNETAMLMLHAVLELSAAAETAGMWAQAEAESFFSPFV